MAIKKKFFLLSLELTAMLAVYYEIEPDNKKKTIEINNMMVDVI